MVLSAADFPLGETILSQSPTPSPLLPHVAYSSAYTRSFPGVVDGSTRLVSLLSSVVVAKNNAKISQFMTSIILAGRDKLYRAQILATVKSEFQASSHQPITGAGYIRERQLHTGDRAFEFDFFITTKLVTLAVGELFVEEGNALEFAIYASGQPGLTAGQSFALAKTIASHIKAASAPPPTNTVLPSTTGTLALGQILTTSPGSWSGSGITYVYQWFRCNASGGACVVIPGATGPTYTISTNDVGATLATSVSATNPAGTTIAMSKATAVVQAS